MLLEVQLSEALETYTHAKPNLQLLSYTQKYFIYLGNCMIKYLQLSYQIRKTWQHGKMKGLTKPFIL